MERPGQDRTEPISFSQAGSPCWLEMASPGESPTTGYHPSRLSSSINLCLLTKQHDVTINFTHSLKLGPRESPTLSVGLSCPVALWDMSASSEKISWTFFSKIVLLLSPPSFSSVLHSRLLFFFFVLSRVVLLALLCHGSSSWNSALLCLYPCYVSSCDDFCLFAEVYVELDAPHLLISPQISCADTGTARSDQLI